MKMNRRVLAVVMVLMICFSAIVSGGGRTEAEGYVIGVSMSQFTQFLRNVAQVIEETAAEHPDIAEVIIYNANADIQQQMTDIESLMAQGVDAIILNPIDREGLNDHVDMIVDDGFPLVQVNTFTSNDRYDVYVGTREEDAGEIQGRWIVENLGESGNAAVLYGVMGHSGQIGRWEGLKSELIDQYPGWELVVDHTGNWDRAEGLRITEDWIESFGDQIDVIASQNDEMAFGALQALQAAGMADKIPVLGIDATPEAIGSVLAGELALTVFQDFVTQGTRSVEVAVGLIEGKTFEHHEPTPFVEVNLENAQEFLDLVERWN